ncbi:MAG: hypothetical protein KME14_16755 [Tildeniella torsiva UHER 1998/13D]|jgi:hypothetical protein|nr:hypothetical protein [Tildeniella torsiva UHER 1998/13D]
MPKFDWEAQKPQGVSAVAHEKGWELEPTLRQELSDLRSGLEAYAHALADIADISQCHQPSKYLADLGIKKLPKFD